MAALHPITIPIDALLAFSRGSLRGSVLLLPGLLRFGGLRVSPSLHSSLTDLFVSRPHLGRRPGLVRLMGTILTALDRSGRSPRLCRPVHRLPNSYSCYVHRPVPDAHDAQDVFWSRALTISSRLREIYGRHCRQSRLWLGRSSPRRHARKSRVALDESQLDALGVLDFCRDSLPFALYYRRKKVQAQV